MCRERILEYLNSDKAFYPTKALRQYWKESRYSYLDAPRPDHGLLLLLRGNVMFVTDTVTVSAQAGNVVFLPKNCHYEAIFLHEAEDYLLCFDLDESAPEFSTPTLLFEKSSLSCAEHFRLLVAENFSSEHMGLKSKGLFYLLLDAIVNQAEAESDEQHQVLNRAKALLHTEKDIPIGEIAKECAVSESSLRQIFREHMGITPVAYRMEWKLRQAMYLLEATALSTHEIAEHLGFFDAAYFCKCFKSHTGISPRQYAQSKKL